MKRKLVNSDEFKENIVDVDYSESLESFYLNYSMSVITDRAVPDVRDGLKPVQRRILFGMNEMGCFSNKPTKKTARIVGEVMGKYHPHGDCLGGNTKVRLLDGSIRTMEELYHGGNDQWVLSLDIETGNIVPAKAHSFRIGQYADTLYEFTLSNGYKFTCTDNHPIFDIKNKWVYAKDFNSGMIPDFITIDKGEYLNISHNLVDTSHIHHLVYRYFYGDSTPLLHDVIHHKNHIKTDNRPENLERINKSSHASHHEDINNLSSLERGRVKMGNDDFFSRRRSYRNSLLMKHNNQYGPERKFIKALNMLETRGLDYTEDNYNSLKSEIYNLTKISTMIRKGYGSCFSEIVNGYLNKDWYIPEFLFEYPDNLKLPEKPIKPHAERNNRYEKRILSRLVNLYKSGKDISYTKYTDVPGYHTVSKYYSEAEYLDIRSSYIPEISNIEVIKLEDKVPMYDFTVDNYSCMYICGDDEGFSNILVHNSSIASAVVTMAQEFKKPYPFIDGQGNFGSLEGDDAAAARYTEVRLTEFSEDCYLDGLKLDTVDFQPNYDETLKEPIVLPCLLPGCLLTGAEGIAVGVTTNIPTHNLGEVVDACIYVLGHPDASLKQIMKKLPAPDFPTGGVICNPEELEKMYTTGEGKIRIRGKFEFEEGKKVDKLIITEVPYTCIGHEISKLLMSIANLVEDKTLPDIVDIVNQTGDSVRIVLEVKKGADIEYIKNTLFARTKLEDTFGAHFLVINRKRPELLGLAQILFEYKDFQFEIYKRKFNYNLLKLGSRKNILEGYITILSDIDNVVSLIKSSESVSDAKKKLAERYSLNEDQCSAIMSMTLSRLVKLSSDEISNELKDVNEEINRIQEILSNEDLLIKEIVSVLKKIKRKFGSPRRTQLESIGQAVAVKLEKPAERVGVLINQLNYIHSIDDKVFEKNIDAIKSDFTLSLQVMDNNRIGLFTNTGLLHKIKVSDISHGSLRAKGDPVENVSNFSRVSEKLIGIVPIDEVEELVVYTESGKVKRLESSAVSNSRKTTDYITLESDDKVIYVGKYNENNVLVVKTESDVHIYPESEVKVCNRGSKGVIGTRLKNGNDKIVSVESISKEEAENLYPKIKFSSMGRVGKTI